MNEKNLISAMSGSKAIVSSVNDNSSRIDDERLDETLTGLDEYDNSTAKEKKGTRAKKKGVNGCYFPGTISESGVFMPDYEDAFWDTGYESYKEAMYDYNSRKKNPATDAEVSGYMVRNAPNITFGIKAFGDHINNALIKPINNVFLLQAAAGGMSPEYAKLYADFSSGMLLDVFGAISIAGIKSTSVLRKGSTFSGDVFAGSGMGNIKKFGITNGAAEADKLTSIINRVKEIRSELPSKLKKSGNFGYAEAEVDGIQQEEFIAHSSIDTATDKGALPGMSFKPEDEPIYKAQKVDPDNARIDTPEAYLRDYDTEYKILNDIAEKLKGNENATGTINLFTERYTCASCSDIILKFRYDHPNIKLNILTNDGKVVK